MFKSAKMARKDPNGLKIQSLKMIKNSLGQVIVTVLVMKFPSSFPWICCKCTSLPEANKMLFSIMT